MINLGVGSPARPPAPHIIEAMHRGLDKLDNYRYTLVGSLALRQAVANWYHNRFGVELNPEHEVLVLMGSQDGLAHIALAYINPGDIALTLIPATPFMPLV